MVIIYKIVRNIYACQQMWCPVTTILRGKLLS